MKIKCPRCGAEVEVLSDGTLATHGKSAGRWCWQASTDVGDSRTRAEILSARLVVRKAEPMLGFYTQRRRSRG